MISRLRKFRRPNVCSTSSSVASCSPGGRYPSSSSLLGIGMTVTQPKSCVQTRLPGEAIATLPMFRRTETVSERHPGQPKAGASLLVTEGGGIVESGHPLGLL